MWMFLLSSAAIESFCAGCVCGIGLYVGKTPLKKLFK